MSKKIWCVSVNKAPKYGNDYAYDEEEMVEDIPHMMDNVDVEGYI